MQRHTNLSQPDGLEGIESGVGVKDGAGDPAQPVYDLRTMDDRILASLGTRRFSVNLMVVFAAVAIFLAAIGLYGVISYVVTQRTHEIGIRMALGAHRKQILALVIRQGMRMTLAGVAIGSAGALILARTLSSQLFQVRPFDPATFGLMAVAVSMVALLACLIPGDGQPWWNRWTRAVTTRRTLAAS